jgi:hypothetical protein
MNARVILSNGRTVKENGGGTVVIRVTQHNSEVVLVKFKNMCDGTSKTMINCTHS